MLTRRTAVSRRNLPRTVKDPPAQQHDTRTRGNDVKKAIGVLAGVMLVAAITGCGGGTRATTGTEAGARTQATTPSATTASPTTAEETGRLVSTSTCSTTTTSTTEGPYYVTGTAALTDGNLNADKLPGDPIRIAGYVYSGTGTTTPLANAVVDIWHADDSGAYWPPSNGPASGYSAEQLRLRGHVVTDAKGYYAFTTISPGEYEGRARHIHIRATSADGSQDVITQLIMSKPGDQTPAANDSIAQSLPPCHTMAFSTINGASTAFFDFHL
jgi:protocatechuate 3,4-dioxygenase beta subunit